MATTSRHLLLIAAAAVSGPLSAQEVEQHRWTLEEFRSRCIPLWRDDPTVQPDDCMVAEFGEIGELDGATLYFARYHDRSRPIPDWVTSPTTHFNALVLLRVDLPEREDAIVVHVRKHEDYQGMFLAPELVQSDRGPILYLAGRGPGDSRSQYNNDEHWLWQSGGRVRLDVHSWLHAMRERMLGGFRLKGIGDLTGALKTLTYVDTQIHREGDGDCCPTGGTVTVRFEWDDLTLRVVSRAADRDSSVAGPTGSPARRSCGRSPAWSRAGSPSAP